MLREALADATRRLTARGHVVRHVGSVSVTSERRTLCFFDAVSANAVVQANRNAMVPFTSIKVAPKNTYRSPYMG